MIEMAVVAILCLLVMFHFWMKDLSELQARVTKLQDLAACAYQLAGYHDAPEKWLDALSQAANGEDFETEELLPYDPEAATKLDQEA